MANQRRTGPSQSGNSGRAGGSGWNRGKGNKSFANSSASAQASGDESGPADASLLSFEDYCHRYGETLERRLQLRDDDHPHIIAQEEDFRRRQAIAKELDAAQALVRQRLAERKRGQDIFSTLGDAETGAAARRYFEHPALQLMLFGKRLPKVVPSKKQPVVATGDRSASKAPPAKVKRKRSARVIDDDDESDSEGDIALLAVADAEVDHDDAANNEEEAKRRNADAGNNDADDDDVAAGGHDLDSDDEEDLLDGLDIANIDADAWDLDEALIDSDDGL